MLNKPLKIDRRTRELREKFIVTTPRPGLLEWLTIPVSALGRWLDVLLLEKRKWSAAMETPLQGLAPRVLQFLLQVVRTGQESTGRLHPRCTVSALWIQA